MRNDDASLFSNMLFMGTGIESDIPLLIPICANKDVRKDIPII